MLCRITLLQDGIELLSCVDLFPQRYGNLLHMLCVYIQTNGNVGGLWSMDSLLENSVTISFGPSLDGSIHYKVDRLEDAAPVFCDSIFYMARNISCLFFVLRLRLYFCLHIYMDEDPLRATVSNDWHPPLPGCNSYICGIGIWGYSFQKNIYLINCTTDYHYLHFAVRCISPF